MNTQEALNWISEIFEEPAGRIDAAMVRAEIPGWDSLGTLSLLAAFDERFDIHLSEQEIESLQSVKDIFEVLRRHDALSA
jgi:acyl carrier protein